MPKFSVIIPTYNRLSMLREALDSVWDQQFTDYEVIVVDDGSTDGTSDWLASLGERVRFFTQPNRGPGAARNVGIQEAGGEYLAFLDSDDRWLPWTLDVYWHAIQKFGEATVVTGRSIGLNEKPPPSSITAVEPTLKNYACFFDAWQYGHGFAGTPGMTVRASELKSIGGFLTDFVNGEDQDLCLRLGSFPAVHVLAPPVFLHRVHTGRVSQHIQRSVAGISLLLKREQNRIYPGGTAWQRSRRRIICAAARTVSMQAVQHRQFAWGWRLYRDTLFWQIEQFRFKYVFGFPLFFFKSFLGVHR